MKIGIRIPSLKKRVAGRTSVKRVVRHRMGVIVFGLLFVVYGLWFMVYGLWFVVCGCGFYFVKQLPTM
ncbi:MAG: hypothetical protein MUF43_09695 [Flavobacterium sp.]|jgi:hypothetical protein|nr:hypothetical protein [Flavobacterium sp.]